MPDFLVVMVLLISSVVGIPQATGKFDRSFPGWAKADQVTVRCNNTVIAQYCHDNQSCPKINKPGVLLEKDSGGVRLTITNCSYDSRSCEAVSYIDHQQQGPENFIVHVCNQAPSTSSSTSSSLGNNESQSGTIAAGVVLLVIVFLVIVFLILYNQVKCFRKTIDGVFSCLQCNNRNPNQEPDIERGENNNFLWSE